MKQYIQKSALVEEIEKWLGETDKGFPNDHNLGRYDMCKKMLSFIDGLEVKEVDLDFQRFAKEMDVIFALPSSETKNTEENPLNWEYAIAKYFFELGIKTQKEK